jgi:integrase
MREPWWRSQTQFWYVEINGKQVRLSKQKDPEGGERKQPPPDVENEWHRLAREGVPSDMRVADLIDLFIESINGTDQAQAKNHYLTGFKASVGTMKITALKPIHLTNFLKKFPAWSPSTIRTCVSRIHAAINYGVRQGLIERNPISSTPGYQREGYFERRKGIISDEDRQIAEAASKPDFRSFLIALRETGARPAELRRVQIEKVNLANGTMNVPNKSARKTKVKERTIYLSEAMKDLLAEQIGDRTEGFVFLMGQGKPWKWPTLQARWKRMAKKMGIKGGLYAYRHTFASTAINDKNVNPALVAQLLGHADLTMLLKHYLEVDPTALQKAVEEINKK